MPSRRLALLGGKAGLPLLGGRLNQRRSWGMHAGRAHTRTCLASLGADPRSWQQLLSLMFGPGEPDSSSGKRPSCLDQKIISRALSGGFKYTFNLR